MSDATMPDGCQNDEKQKSKAMTWAVFSKSGLGDGSPNGCTKVACIAFRSSEGSTYCRGNPWACGSHSPCRLMLGLSD